MQQKELLAAEQRRLDALAKMESESGKVQPAQALEHPWANRPAVEVFVDGCNKVIYQLPLNIQDWNFADASCDGSQISVSYKRSGNSTTTELLSATAGHFYGRPTFYEQGNSAMLRYELSLPVAGDEPLLEAVEASATLSSWLHRFSQEPTLNEVPVVVPQPPALPGQPTPPPPPPPQWKQFELRYTTGVLPHDSLTGAPNQGLRMREIKAEFKANHLMWTVTGDLYAK